MLRCAGYLRRPVPHPGIRRVLFRCAGACYPPPIGRWGVEGAMNDSEVVCAHCGSAAVRKDGRDRKGAQVHRCRDCGRCFTALTATPFSGYRFPPDVIALAVRWYVRYRLSYADVAELLAERGITVAP